MPPLAPSSPASSSPAPSAPPSSVLARLPLAPRLALRDLRGGLSGFRVFLACLALGVAAIAAAGSLNAGIEAGLRADARVLLGGDLEVSLRTRALTEAEQATLADLGTLAVTQEMRSMVRRAALSTGAPDPEAEARPESVMVEVKAVPPAYPLYGAVGLESGQALAEALAPGPEGLPGAVAAPALAQRLGLEIGDRLRLGGQTLVLSDLILREPDDLAGAFRLGPRLMVSDQTLAATGLVQPGSLITTRGLLRLTDGLSDSQARARLGEAHPEAGWRIRGTDEAGAGLQSTLDRLTLFLVLVGLTSLLVGGIGVANAAKAHLEGRTDTIATLKCLGAPAGLIHRVYLIQMGVIAGLGVAIGLGLGALAPPLLAGLMGDMLPVPAKGGIYPLPLALAGVFGLLVAVIFSLWPLARARAVPATALFRGAVAVEAAETPIPGAGAGRLRWRLPLPWRDLAVLLGLALVLIGLVLLSAERPVIAAWFVVGALGALALFRLAAWGLIALARRLPVPPGRPSLRLAVANLHRPGAPTASVVVSLGLGLSVLVALALIEGNLGRQIARDMPDRAPNTFFIDIQPEQVEAFRAVVAESAPGADLRMADMVRGRVRALNGVPVDQAEVDPGARWALRGDRGFTTAATLPEGSTLVDGTWWEADEGSAAAAGAPLFSLTEDLAEGFGLAIGDSVTVNILGRDIIGRLANTRAVRWTSLSMNFSFVVAPGSFQGAPRTWIATLKGDAEAVRAAERAVTARFANVSTIDVRAALDRVAGVLGTAAQAVRAAAAVTLASGILVLAGAFAATHRRRLKEAVTLKVLGATRGVILGAYALEYGLIGLLTGLVAAGVGGLAAWAVVTQALGGAWTFLPGVVAVTLPACVLVTLAGGFVGTWRALGQRPALLLRGEGE